MMAMGGMAGGLVCPSCRIDLVMSERHGIEIDYCPKCRGVWLDRGELDKIIEKNRAHEAAPAAQPVAQPGWSQPQPYPAQPHAPQHYQQPYPPQQGGWGHKRGKRRDSFLEMLFD